MHNLINANDVVQRTRSLFLTIIEYWRILYTQSQHSFGNERMKNNEHEKQPLAALLVNALVAPTHVRSCVHVARVRRPERINSTLVSILPDVQLVCLVTTAEECRVYVCGRWMVTCGLYATICHVCQLRIMPRQCNPGYGFGAPHCHNWLQTYILHLMPNIHSKLEIVMIKRTGSASECIH